MSLSVNVLTLNSSMILRMAFPRAPMMRAWTRRSSRTSSLTISCSAATSCSMADLASLAFLSYPEITITSYSQRSMNGTSWRMRAEEMCSVVNTYLQLITLVWELNVYIILSADLRDDSSFAADDFGVIFGVHWERYFVAPQGL